MTLIESAIDVLQRATELNLEDPIRKGSLLCFPDYGQVVMTGDLHGHRRNFEKLVKYCQLESTPNRHVLLHEMIHAAVGIDAGHKGPFKRAAIAVGLAGPMTAT